mgnify:CR=1 FL=1
MPGRVLTELERKTRELRREIQRKAKIAHKRLERLEKNNLTNLPAYQQWVKEGKVRFGVKGKSYNELQAELARLNRFLDSKTSLVRQANKHLQDIAQMTGVKYKSVKELPGKLENFFRISEKVDEYLRNVEGSASAIGYHKIWEVVNEVVESEEMDLNQAEDELTEEMIQKINELIETQHEADWVRAEMNWKEITPY